MRRLASAYASDAEIREFNRRAPHDLSSSAMAARYHRQWRGTDCITGSSEMLPKLFETPTSPSSTTTQPITSNTAGRKATVDRKKKLRFPWDRYVAFRQPLKMLQQFTHLTRKSHGEVLWRVELFAFAGEVTEQALELSGVHRICLDPEVSPGTSHVGK